MKIEICIILLITSIPVSSQSIQYIEVIGEGKLEVPATEIEYSIWEENIANDNDDLSDLSSDLQLMVINCQGTIKGNSIRNYTVNPKYLEVNSVVAIFSSFEQLTCLTNELTLRGNFHGYISNIESGDDKRHFGLLLSAALDDARKKAGIIGEELSVSIGNINFIEQMENIGDPADSNINRKGQWTAYAPVMNTPASPISASAPLVKKSLYIKVQFAIK